jgi:hypothetical protein
MEKAVEKAFEEHAPYGEPIVHNEYMVMYDLDEPMEFVEYEA